MNKEKTEYLYCVGLSYKKANADIRGKFSLDDNAVSKLLSQAKMMGMNAVLVTSTCNRTEIVGYAPNPFQFIQLLCDNTPGTIGELEHVVHVYKENQAIDYLFRVGAGLESQIVGDFEIISQIKKAFKLSKKQQLINTNLERFISFVIQASKRIKNETTLSSGATSISFAAVHHILNTIQGHDSKKVLLFGTGKIGQNTCENLVKHAPNVQLTLINRTQRKAEKIGRKFDVNIQEYDNLIQEINDTDILIVGTGASQPTITKNMILTEKALLILDLSIPKNVADDVANWPNVKLVHMDQLSLATDKIVEQRLTQIPVAEAIIEEMKGEFLTWLESRKFAPVIRAFKAKLEQIKLEELDYHNKKVTDFNAEQAEMISDRIIQKITKHFSVYLRQNGNPSDDALTIISKVFHLEEIGHD